MSDVGRGVMGSDFKKRFPHVFHIRDCPQLTL